MSSNEQLNLITRKMIFLLIRKAINGNDINIKEIYDFLIGPHKFDKIFANITPEKSIEKLPEYKHKLFQLLLTNFYESMHSNVILDNIEWTEEHYNIAQELINQIYGVPVTIDSIKYEVEGDLNDISLVDKNTITLLEKNYSLVYLWDIFKKNTEFAYNIIDRCVYYEETFTEEDRFNIIKYIFGQKKEQVFDFYNPLHKYERERISKKFNKQTITVTNELDNYLNKIFQKFNGDTFNIITYLKNKNYPNPLLIKMVLLFYKQAVINIKIHNLNDHVKINFCNLVEKDNTLEEIMNETIKNDELLFQIIQNYKQEEKATNKIKLEQYILLNQLKKEPFLEKFNPIYTADKVILTLEKSMLTKNF